MADEQLRRNAFTVTCTDQTFRDIVASQGADFRIKLKILNCWKQGTAEAKQVKFRWSITDQTPFLFQELIDAMTVRQDVKFDAGQDYLIGPKGAALQVQAADGSAGFANSIFGTVFYLHSN